jgi:CHASE3 domain sensor protein
VSVPNNTALPSLGSQREQLRRLTADNPSQQAQLAALDQLNLQDIERTEREHQCAAAAESCCRGAGRRDQPGQHVRERIRAVIATMRGEE